MSNTFTQLYVHVVFATKVRMNLIKPEYQKQVYEYIAGIIKHSGSHPILINGMTDHVHLLFRYKADCNLSYLVRDIKSGISGHINKNGWVAGKFEWQSGYGAFSVSRSMVDKVYHYIENQEKHHEKKSFTDEFIELLEAHGIEYNKDYIFHTIEQ